MKITKLKYNIDDTILKNFAADLVKYFEDDMLKSVVALTYILTKEGGVSKKTILEIIENVKFNHIDDTIKN